MAIFNFAIIDTLTFTSSMTGAADPHPFVDNLVFSDILCLTIIKTTPFTDTLVFNQYVTYSFPDPNDPRNNQGGAIIDDPTDGAVFGGITFKRTIIDFLEFRQVVGVSGGSTWDYSCNPPRLVPNDVFLIWEFVDTEDWGTLTDVGWELMET